MYKITISIFNFNEVEVKVEVEEKKGLWENTKVPGFFLNLNLNAHLTPAVGLVKIYADIAEG